MDKIQIMPWKLSGNIKIPPSKSLSHRAIICAALCRENGESIIKNLILSEDIKATIEAMSMLGVKMDMKEEKDKTFTLRVSNSESYSKEVKIDCRESGSTLRFLIPIALVLSNKSEFIGKGKLVERPLDVYYKIFKEQGIKYENDNGKLPLIVHDRLKGGTFEVDGNISSQFISGLFFALPLLEHDSIIKVINNMESKGYIDLTLDVLKKFNVNIENRDYKEFRIKGNSKYRPIEYKVESDFSQGAFFIVAKEIGNDINYEGLSEDSLQGDKEILNIVKTFRENKKEEFIIDASQIPDLVPILTVLASLKQGVRTRILNAERLRIKESDRLKAIATELNKLGAHVEETTDGLIINGVERLKGGAIVNSWNDHRIAMSLAVAATRCEDAIILEDHMSVKKSYPNFWEDYEALGGKIHGCSLGK